MSLLSAASLLPHSTHLRIDGVSVSFHDTRVLTDVTCVVSSGHRTGLIGENGSGKSTLLRVAAGLLPPDAGSVTVVGARGLAPRIGLLRQTDQFTRDQTIDHALESCVSHTRAAVSAVNDAALDLAQTPDDPVAAEVYADALDLAGRLQAWDLDARIAAMLSGLGLGNLPRNRTVGDLSGGQRARVALAGLLLSAPDVLLLDEPTNHLDDAATNHLRRTLLECRGPVLIASHDRAFLDETATDLIDLDPAPSPQSAADTVTDSIANSGTGAVHFTGTYTAYLVHAAAVRDRWETQYRDEQAALKRLRASVSGGQTVGHHDWAPRTEVRAAQKFYADRNARVVSRRVNDARARLEDLEKRQVRKPPTVLQFSGFPSTTASPEPGTPAAQLSLVNASVDGRLAPLSLSVGTGEKLLVTGLNGAGKSTLLRIIAGDVSLTSGQLNIDGSARVGLLTQETALPDPHDRGAQRTVHQTYVDLVGPERADELPLSSFGLIARRDEHRRLATLSLGQQRRLALAVLLAHPPEIILLDEPTNHLSLRLVTELEAAIPAYQGTVIVASHDRWLRRHWGGRRLHLDPA